MREKYAFLKPAIDAHTLGLISATELLEGSGYQVELATRDIQEAIVRFRDPDAIDRVIKWLEGTKAAHFALSYRLDGRDAVQMLGRLIYQAQEARLFVGQGGQLKQLYYAGLPDACRMVDREFQAQVLTFSGGESAGETLRLLGVPEEEIPEEYIQAAQYDESLMAFGRELVQRQDYLKVKPADRRYPGFGSTEDSLTKRLAALPTDHYQPILRAHVGPYDAHASRRENVDTFLGWARALGQAGYLDVLSVGSSQLTQSRFGESWEDEVNGGGVPIATAEEFSDVWAAARPMLVRTYAGTKNLPALAKIYEEHLHIAWHAMSLWWFNRLDDRGPYGLLENLQQQMETLRYIAGKGTPFEANVSHHFSFRGTDDVSYIFAAYLTAKLAKRFGVRTHVLQNMLNTPRSTWGTVDIAKSRALLELIRALEDDQFRVVHQPRAGLDYFKPDLGEARAQLATVSALMDDIEPLKADNPKMIHVVSYSEAAHLADPEIINESLQITLHAIRSYRRERSKGNTFDTLNNPEIDALQRDFVSQAQELINACETYIPNLYSPEGFYKVFAAGFLPVPYLWRDVEKYPHAVNWKTGQHNGLIRLVREDGGAMPVAERIELARENLAEIVVAD